MQIVIHRKDLINQDLPLKDITLENVRFNIIHKLRPESTLVLIIDNDKKSGICSKVLHTPVYCSPNVVMSENDYDIFKEQAEKKMALFVFRYLAMRKVPKHIILKYIEESWKQQTWNIK